MKSIVILISGRGSNLQALIAACEREQWAARITAVISDRPDAAGLEIARAAGIATAVVEPRAYPDRDAFGQALEAQLAPLAPALVVLAGYMRILPPSFVLSYEGRLLNIHPSLLPAFPGLHPHRQALAAAVRVHGATVHLVNCEVDQGAIVAQAIVPVLPGDSEAELALRVQRVEHRLYPRVVRWFIEGRVTLDGGRVSVNASPDELLIDGLDRTLTR